MKGEAMQSPETKETAPAPRRRVMWIGLGAVTVLAIAFGLWFGTQPGSRPKPRQRTAMSSMADMSAPSNDDSTDSTAANADLQVELGPDDLKKAQAQTAVLEGKKTSSHLAVPRSSTQVKNTEYMYI